MKYFDPIIDFFKRIDARLFWQLLIGFLTSLTLILMFLVYRHYRTINLLQEDIEEINELRKKTRRILTQAHQVQTQRDTVKKLLESNLDFKIGGYFENLLNQLNLSTKKEMDTISTIDRQDNYRENILNAKFVDMNMKELTELLAELDKNPLIFTKELDIMQSEKKPKTLDVTLTIATLEPKETT